MEVSGQLHAPAALPSGKQLLVPLDRRLSIIIIIIIIIIVLFFVNARK
jgi:hypothetical protein